MRWCLCLVGLIAFSAYSQAVENVTATFVDNKVIVSFDLTGGPTGQKYNVELLSSKDDYQAPIVNAQGDLRGILAGTGKRIVVFAEEEFVELDKLLMFKVRARFAGLPVTLKTPAKNAKMKLGKHTTISWQGGEPNQTLTLELMQNASVMHPIGTTENKGSFIWAVPKTIKKGTYTLRISGPTSITESAPFTIKKKTPVWLFIAPVAIGGGLFALLSGGGGGNGGTPGVSDLPGAPGPN